MRHIPKVFSGALLLLVLTLTGCDNPANVETTTTIVDNTGSFAVSGSVAGRVVDAAGLPVAGVTVAYNSPARTLSTATTNTQGMYEITGLPSGAYEIFLGGGNYTTDSQTFSILNLEEIVLQTKVGMVYTELETSTVPEGQYYIDQFGIYHVNQNLPDTIVYPLTASVKGVALIETVDAEYNRVTTVAPTGYTVGIQVSTMGDSQLEIPVLPVPLDGIYTGKVGVAGAFLIEKLPAAFPTPLIYYFFIISSDNATTAVAYKINDEMWHIAGEAESANDFDGFATALRGNEIVDTGEITFAASKKPVITEVSPNAPATDKFLPGTTLAPTPLVFTFSKAMMPDKGTITVIDDATIPASYVVDAVWNSTTVLTVTPTTPFEYGTVINATLSGFEAADGVAMDEDIITFNVRDALAQVTTSWYSPWTNTDVQKVDITASPTITFNYALTGYTVASTQLLLGTLPIDAAFTFTGNTLTINPDESLDFNKTYTIKYEVTDGVTKVTVASLQFTTETGGTLGVPGLTFDTSEKLLATSSVRSTYNGGDTPIYIVITTVASINDIAPTYAVEFRKTTDLEWTTGGATGVDPWFLSPVSVNATTMYATITNVTWASGDGYLFRIRASHTGALEDTVSTELTLTDATAPTAATIAGAAWDGTTADLIASLITINLPPTADYAGYFSFTITLAGSELLGTLTVNSGTLLAADAVFDRITYSLDGTTATVRYVIPKTAAATTYGGKTLTIIIRDMAGNSPADYNRVLTGTQSFITLTL